MGDSKLCLRLVKKGDLKNFSQITISISSNNMKTQMLIKDSTERDTTISRANRMDIRIKEITIKDNTNRI
jgi:hypothetical protein